MIGSVDWITLVTDEGALLWEPRPTLLTLYTWEEEGAPAALWAQELTHREREGHYTYQLCLDGEALQRRVLTHPCAATARDAWRRAYGWLMAGVHPQEVLDYVEVVP